MDRYAGEAEPTLGSTIHAGELKRVKEPEVPVALEVLSDALDRAEKMFESLHERLMPVLGESSVNPCDKAEGRGHSTPLAGRINAETERVCRLGDNLADVLNRLEL